ncbi:MAG: hypothetical protein EOO15_07665 [Chitinophagaceae bacterium]|nr:MAG: hypothetical protein EOO15_07665 [Chitinophagaceae bacterium]
MLVIVLGVFIALCFAYYFRQKRRIALEQRQETLQRKQDALMHLLRLRKEREQRDAEEENGARPDQDA